MLTHCTRKPVIYDEILYGGDNKLLYLLNLIGENSFISSHEELKNKYLFAVKMDNIAIRQILETEYEIFYQTVLSKVDSNVVKEITAKEQQNKRDRERLIYVLGGINFCDNIPVIYPKILGTYPNFTLNDMPIGHSLAQYEDNAGRKGLLIKLHDKISNEFKLVWCFERYRETHICEGPRWFMSGAVKLEGINNIIKFLYQIRPHEQYELAK